MACFHGSSSCLQEEAALLCGCQEVLCRSHWLHQGSCHGCSRKLQLLAEAASCARGGVTLYCPKSKAPVAW